MHILWLSPTLLGSSAETAVAPSSSAPTTTIVQPGFKEIVFDMGLVNLLVWIMLFLCSFAALALIIDGVVATRRKNLLPGSVVGGVKAALDQGQIDTAMQICAGNRDPLSHILTAGFAVIRNGFEAVQDAVRIATDLEGERILQRISYLNLCGQIAPMLGLLGTVVGMVQAFASLASEAGAAKSQMLALAISTALWTTVAGLLISIPALLGYAIFKNAATRLLMESQATVIDLIKDLRFATVEE